MNNSNRNRRSMFKVVVVGDVIVGKTSLCARYTNNTFTEYTKATIGCDFRAKSVEVDGNPAVLQIWDTTGQEQYHALNNSFYRNTDGLVIVYDVTSMQSFADVTNWLRTAESCCGQNPIKERLLVGNKTDMTTQRVVDFEQAKTLADSLELPYIETSAKDGQNVHLAFDSLAQRMMQSCPRNVEDDFGAGVIKLDRYASDVPQYSGYCCGYI